MILSISSIDIQPNRYPQSIYKGLWHNQAVDAETNLSERFVGQIYLPMQVHSQLCTVFTIPFYSSYSLYASIERVSMEQRKLLLTISEVTVASPSKRSHGGKSTGC